MKYKDKKIIFSEISDKIYLSESNKDEIRGFRISSLDSYDKIVEEIKTLNIIELDDIEGFLPFINFDHFIIFKVEGDYYFCDTELVPILGKHSMLRIDDYKHHLRKDKIKEINHKSDK